MSAPRDGIKFFSTGGIGGVHLNYEKDMDVSSDLYELSKNNICVICSGAKSILDINKTFEMLETFGIPRIGFNTNYMPGFWYYQTDNLVDYNDETVMEYTVVTAELMSYPADMNGEIFLVNSHNSKNIPTQRTFN